MSMSRFEPLFKNDDRFEIRSINSVEKSIVNEHLSGDDAKYNANAHRNDGFNPNHAKGFLIKDNISQSQYIVAHSVRQNLPSNGISYLDAADTFAFEADHIAKGATIDSHFVILSSSDSKVFYPDIDNRVKSALGFSEMDFKTKINLPISTNGKTFDAIDKQAELEGLTKESIAALIERHQNQVSLEVNASPVNIQHQNLQSQQLIELLNEERERLRDGLAETTENSSTLGFGAKQHMLFQASMTPERFGLKQTEDGPILLYPDQVEQELNNRLSKQSNGGMTELSVNHMIGNPIPETLQTIKRIDPKDTLLAAMDIKKKDSENITTVYAVIDSQDRGWIRTFEHDQKGNFIKRSSHDDIGLDDRKFTAHVSLKKGNTDFDTLSNQREFNERSQDFSAQISPSALRANIVAGELNAYKQAAGIEKPINLSPEALDADKLTQNDLTILSDTTKNSAKIAGEHNTLKATERFVKNTFADYYDIRELSRDDLLDFKAYTADHPYSNVSQLIDVNNLPDNATGFVIDNHIYHDGKSIDGASRHKTIVTQNAFAADGVVKAAEFNFNSSRDMAPKFLVTQNNSDHFDFQAKLTEDNGNQLTVQSIVDTISTSQQTFHQINVNPSRYLENKGFKRNQPNAVYQAIKDHEKTQSQAATEQDQEPQNQSRSGLRK